MHSSSAASAAVLAAETLPNARFPLDHGYTTSAIVGLGVWLVALAASWPRSSLRLGPPTPELARYETESGVIAYYDSIANDGTENSYCMQFIGSRGVIVLHIDRDPLAHFIPGSPFQPTLEPVPWIPITTAGVGEKESQPEWEPKRSR